MIIGAECSLSCGLNIRTADIHSIMTIKQWKDSTMLKACLLENHVLIGYMICISRGVKICLGAIVDNYSIIPHNARIHSNSLVVGNLVRVEKWRIFYKSVFRLS